MLRKRSGADRCVGLSPPGDITGIFKPGRRVKSARFLGVAGHLRRLHGRGPARLWVWLWLVPYVFVVQVLNRLRSVAEHGGLTRSADRRHHARQSLIARFMFVPIGVGYHLAHHVDSGIPFRNLPRFQRILEEDGYITSDLTWPTYRALWKLKRQVEHVRVTPLPKHRRSSPPEGNESSARWSHSPAGTAFATAGQFFVNGVGGVILGASAADRDRIDVTVAGFRTAADDRRCPGARR
ncbi:MAG: fatty acid desaturase [Acidimicrobiales bacterium]